jgi:hypothetical protein
MHLDPEASAVLVGMLLAYGVGLFHAAILYSRWR